MKHKQIVESLTELIGRVGEIEKAVERLGLEATGPVAVGLERTREGTSLLRGLLWSARMAVEAERKRALGQQGSLP